MLAFYLSKDLRKRVFAQSIEISRYAEVPKNATVVVLLSIGTSRSGFIGCLKPHAADAAIERTQFDQDTARRAEIIRSAQEARSIQIRRQFIKNMLGWLGGKLLEQAENTVEDFCIFVRKELSIRKLCKTDDSVMDGFSGMGPSVTDRRVMA